MGDGDFPGPPHPQTRGFGLNLLFGGGSQAQGLDARGLVGKGVQRGRPEQQVWVSVRTGFWAAGQWLLTEQAHWEGGSVWAECGGQGSGCKQRRGGQTGVNAGLG